MKWLRRGWLIAHLLSHPQSLATETDKSTDGEKMTFYRRKTAWWTHLSVRTNMGLLTQCSTPEEGSWIFQSTNTYPSYCLSLIHVERERIKQGLAGRSYQVKGSIIEIKHHPTVENAEKMNVQNGGVSEKLSTNRSEKPCVSSQ